MRPDQITASQAKQTRADRGRAGIRRVKLIVVFVYRGRKQADVMIVCSNDTDFKPLLEEAQSDRIVVEQSAEYLAS